MLTTRGVQLAALFMRGVESAILCNDACGAPIPWSMCCPWHFFDGKLFHFKLLKANNNTPIIDICDGHVRLRNIYMAYLYFNKGLFHGNLCTCQCVTLGRGGAYHSISDVP